MRRKRQPTRKREVTTAERYSGNEGSRGALSAKSGERGASSWHGLGAINQRTDAPHSLPPNCHILITANTGSGDSTLHSPPPASGQPRAPTSSSDQNPKTFHRSSRTITRLPTAIPNPLVRMGKIILLGCPAPGVSPSHSRESSGACGGVACYCNLESAPTLRCLEGAREEL